MEKLVANGKRLRHSIGDGDYDRAYAQKAGMAVTGRGPGPSGIDAAVTNRQPKTSDMLTPRSDRLPIKPGPNRSKPSSENTRELMNRLDEEDRLMNRISPLRRRRTI